MNIWNFLGRTWFLWWTVATFVILRWFHAVTATRKRNASDCEYADELSQGAGANRPQFQST